jgi:hypothetical protein
MSIFAPITYLRRPGTFLKKGAWTSKNFCLVRSFVGSRGGFLKEPLVAEGIWHEICIDKNEVNKMKWLEIIELRSVGKHQAQVEQGLAGLTAGSDPEIKPQAIKVYRNSTIETDWSIHLHHESEQDEIRESSLGLRLADALRRFGLVHHTVWVGK